MLLRRGMGRRVAYSAAASASVPAFDPATLTLEGWWRNFAGSPWTPTASAGGSGTAGRNLETNLGLPGTGTLDGYGTADFSGTLQTLVSTQAATTHITASAGTIIVLAKADTAVAAASDFYDDPGLVAETGGFIGLVFTASGVRAGVFNASSKQTTHIAQATGAWFMASARWDGTNIRCRVNSTDATPVAAVGGASSVGTNIYAGRNYSGTRLFDGQIADIITDTSSMSDADLASVYSYFKARYPSAGLP